MQLIDLSVPLQHDAPGEPLPAKIRYITHEGEGLAQMRQFFGARVEDLVWSGGKGWAIEEIQAITHTGIRPRATNPATSGRLGRTRMAMTLPMTPPRPSAAAITPRAESRT